MDRAAELNTTKVLRHINALRCLRLLHDGRAMSRAELARELGLTRTTVGYAVVALANEGYVVEGEVLSAEGRIGRPGVAVSLNATGAYFIGVDVGTRNLTGVLIDLGMNVVARIIEPTGSHFRDADEVLERLLALVDRLLAKADVNRDKIVGLCVSIPGLVSRDGTVINAPFLEWRDYPLRARLVGRCKPDWIVEVRNDAAAFANAEASSLAGEASSVLLILLAEGIGGAVIDSGIQVTGAHGYSGEIGHMTITAGNRTDTFELLAGARSFRHLLSPGRTVAEGVEEMLGSLHDPDIARSLNDWAEALAVGLTNAVYLLDPGSIVLGGPIAALFPVVADRVRERLAGKLLAGLAPPTISVAQFGPDGAAIGAAATLREVIFAMPELGTMKSDMNGDGPQKSR